MDPITVAMMGAGLVSTAVGAFEKFQGAQAQTTAQINEIGLEQQQQAVRRKAMEVTERRQSMEQLRFTQQAAARATAGAAAGGALQGSGYAGGQAQVSAEGGLGQLGLSQNLQAGEQMFDISNLISQQKIAYAQAGGQMNLGSGLMTLGSGLSQSAKGAGQLGQLFGGGSSNAFGPTGIPAF